MAGRKKRFTKEQVIEAIRKHDGFMYLAAQELGCHINTVVTYKNENPEIAEAIEQCKGTMLDIAENVLMKSVKEGQAWAVCFFLKTQGKKRGYVERTEVTGKDGDAVKTETRGLIEEHKGELAQYRNWKPDGEAVPPLPPPASESPPRVAPDTPPQ